MEVSSLPSDKVLLMTFIMITSCHEEAANVAKLLIIYATCVSSQRAQHPLSKLHQVGKHNVTPISVRGRKEPVAQHFQHSQTTDETSDAN